MQIRKFVIAIVSTFDDKGNRKAQASMRETRKQAAELTKQYVALDRSQEAAAQSANKLAKGADDADDELAKLQRQTADLDDEIKKLNVSIGKQRKRLAELNTRSLKDVGASFEGASDRLGKFRSALAPVGELAATAARGLLAFGAAGAAVGAGVIKVGTEFESLRAQLKTVEGSAGAAEAAFNTIQNFAATTPFQLEGLTSAFVALRARGVRPTTDTLTGLGDLASAFGQDFTSVVDSIAAAARGELDPIEKFGISAKIAGEQIQLSFKGQTVAVDRSADAVTQALVAFGQMEGVQGAMAEQSQTTAGVISNLRDTVSQLLDQIAQMGVLDEFKGLLGDISGLSGTRGLAGTIAEGLVAALKAMREALASITEEDIRAFLEGAIDLAKALAAALGLVTDALRFFVDASDDAGDAMINLTLLATGLVAAFTGPAGIVVAAGAVGAALGNMAASAIRDMEVMSAVAAALDTRIAQLQRSIEQRQARIASIEARTQKLSDQSTRREEAAAKKRSQRLERQAGGLGAGLLREDLSAEDQGFQAQFIEVGEGADVDAARARLFTEAGQQVTAGIAEAEQRKIEQVERRARREARKAGRSQAQIDQAAAAARRGAQSAAEANRRKAFETAQKTFAETGSAEAATEAGQKQVAGRGKKGGLGAGKRADTFFDFEQQVERAARSQAETFAQQELERLRSENVAIQDAIAQSRAAGKKRAEVLTQRFLEAGKIFEPDNEDNILDILGLKGPGSVLAGRPAPEVLTINIAPTINLLSGDINLTQTFEGTEEGLQTAIAAGGETLVREAMAPTMAQVEEKFEQMIGLLGDELIGAAGGGTLTQGPPG